MCDLLIIESFYLLTILQIDDSKLSPWSCLFILPCGDTHHLIFLWTDIYRLQGNYEPRHACRISLKLSWFYGMLNSSVSRILSCFIFKAYKITDVLQFVNKRKCILLFCCEKLLSQCNMDILTCHQNMNELLLHFRWGKMGKIVNEVLYFSEFI